MSAKTFRMVVMVGTIDYLIRTLRASCHLDDIVSDVMLDLSVEQGARMEQNPFSSSSLQNMRTRTRRNGKDQSIKINHDAKRKFPICNSSNMAFNGLKQCAQGHGSAEPRNLLLFPSHLSQHWRHIFLGTTAYTRILARQASE